MGYCKDTHPGGMHACQLYDNYYAFTKHAVYNILITLYTCI